jgi:acyl-CoA thioester hydrolase
MSSIETYRGTVYRWEVDHVDHFTVAYYFARFEDATDAVLFALGLDPVSLAGSGHAGVTQECRVHYKRELRVGDILHIQSGVIAVEETGLLLGHQVFDSADDTLCTTVEQRVALVDSQTREPRPLTTAHRAAARALQIDGPVEVGAKPPSEPIDDEGFIDSARDIIRPSEVDVLGHAAFPAFIHRFSAANGHLLARFGVTPDYMKQQRRGFSTFEFLLRFAGAVRAGDPVRVRSALLHVGNSSLRLLHRLSSARTGDTVATLQQAGVHLDIDARRPAPLPESLRERAKAMLVG